MPVSIDIESLGRSILLCVVFRKQGDHLERLSFIYHSC